MLVEHRVFCGLGQMRGLRIWYAFQICHIQSTVHVSMLRKPTGERSHMHLTRPPLARLVRSRAPPVGPTRHSRRFARHPTFDRQLGGRESRSSNQTRFTRGQSAVDVDDLARFTAPPPVTSYAVEGWQHMRRHSDCCNHYVELREGHVMSCVKFRCRDMFFRRDPF